MPESWFVLLQSDLAYDAKYYCPYHGKKTSPLPAPVSTLDSPNWKNRFAYAQKGWRHHDAKSLSTGSWGISCYKTRIEKNMKGIQKVFLKLQTKQQRQEALAIFINLSEMHRFKHTNFLFRYIEAQYRLLELSRSVGNIGRLLYNDGCWYANGWKHG